MSSVLKILTRFILLSIHSGVESHPPLYSPPQIGVSHTPNKTKKREVVKASRILNISNLHTLFILLAKDDGSAVCRVPTSAHCRSENQPTPSGCPHPPEKYEATTAFPISRSTKVYHSLGRYKTLRRTPSDAKAIPTYRTNTSSRNKRSERDPLLPRPLPSLSTGKKPWNRHCIRR